jgi:hypothetical protein
VSDLIVPKEAKVVQGRIEDPDRLARIHGWSMLGWSGAILALVAGADLVLDLIPVHGAGPEWQTSAANLLITGLWGPALGLAMVLGSAVGRRKRVTIAVVSVTFGLFAVLTAAAGYYLLSLSPAVLEKAASPAVLAAAKQEMVRAAVRAAAHTVGFALVAGAGWKYT